MRARSQENAGKSPVSWKKHDEYLWPTVRSQAHAWRIKHPRDRCVLIDMHAGDGKGVPRQQLTMLGDSEYHEYSFSTARILHLIAAEIGHADVILCEQLQRKRSLLAQNYPQALLLTDHAEMIHHLTPDYRWALVLNDPNGYADHGLDSLAQLHRMIACDSVIVFNQFSLKERLLRMRPGPVLTDSPWVAKIRGLQDEYRWMLDLSAWQQRLGVEHIAWTPYRYMRNNFGYRVLLATRHFSRIVKCPFFEEIR